MSAIASKVFAGDRIRVSVPATTSSQSIGDPVKAVLSLNINGAFSSFDLTDREDDRFVGFAVIPDVHASSLRYTVALVDADDHRLTIEESATFLENINARGQSTDERILALLESVLIQKLEGRGDVVSYSLGGRSIATLSIAEINAEIRATRQRIEAQKRGGRTRKHLLWGRRSGRLSSRVETRSGGGRGGDGAGGVDRSIRAGTYAVDNGAVTLPKQNDGGDVVISGINAPPAGSGTAAPWAEVGNTDTIPDSKIPDDIARDSELPAAISANVQDWAEVGNDDPIPADKLTNAPTRSDADIDGRILPFARTGNTDQLPANKLAVGGTTAQVLTRTASGQEWADATGGGSDGTPPATWAEQGNTDTIPDSKIPDDIARDSEIPTNAQITALADAAVRAGVANWAETANTDPIPANKLTNAPSGGGGLDQNAVDIRVAVGRRAIALPAGSTEAARLNAADNGYFVHQLLTGTLGLPTGWYHITARDSGAVDLVQTAIRLDGDDSERTTVYRRTRSSGQWEDSDEFVVRSNAATWARTGNTDQVPIEKLDDSVNRIAFNATTGGGSLNTIAEMNGASFGKHSVDVIIDGSTPLQEGVPFHGILPVGHQASPGSFQVQGILEVDRGPNFWTQTFESADGTLYVRATRSLSTSAQTRWANIDFNRLSSSEIPSDLTAFTAYLDDSGVITSANALGDGIVRTDNIEDDAVGSDQIANSAVGTAQVATRAITENKLALAVQTKLNRVPNMGEHRTVSTGWQAKGPRRENVGGSLTIHTAGSVHVQYDEDATGGLGELVYYTVRVNRNRPSPNNAPSATEPVYVTEAGQHRASGILLSHAATQAKAIAWHQNDHVDRVIDLPNLQRMQNGEIRTFSMSEDNDADIWVYRLESDTHAGLIQTGSAGDFLVTLAENAPHLRRLIKVVWQEDASLAALRGEDGTDGEDGEDGDDGQPGVNPVVQAQSTQQRDDGVMVIRTATSATDRTLTDRTITLPRGPAGSDALPVPATEIDVATPWVMSTLVTNIPGQNAQLVAEQVDTSGGNITYPAHLIRANTGLDRDGVFLDVDTHAVEIACVVGDNTEEAPTQINFGRVDGIANGTTMRRGVRSAHDQAMYARLERLSNGRFRVGLAESGAGGNANRLYAVMHREEHSTNSLRGLDGGTITSIVVTSDENGVNGRIRYSTRGTILNPEPVPQPDVTFSLPSGHSEAAIRALIADWAQTNNVDTIPTAKLATGGTTGQVLTRTAGGHAWADSTGGGGTAPATWAEVGNTDAIPDSKIGVNIARTTAIRTNADIDGRANTRINAVVQDWARDTTTAIPASKLTNAPSTSDADIDARTVTAGSYNSANGELTLTRAAGNVVITGLPFVSQS